MAETYGERKFWNPDIETMPRKEIRKLQEKKLFRELIYAYENAPFYHELYDKEKVDVYRIRTIEDFQKYVPLVDKDILREYGERTGDPFGGICCLPLTLSNFPNPTWDQSVGKFVRSTGTTGLPTISMYSKHDVDEAAEVACREFWRGGMRPGERIGIYLPRPWHPGVDTYASAAVARLGAFVYWGQLMPWEPCLDVMRRIDIEYFLSAVIPLRFIAQKLEREGKTLKDYFPHLKAMKQTGELAESIGEYYYKVCRVPIVDCYGVCEVGSQHGSCLEEAEEKHWSLYDHLAEDKFLFEILDPRTTIPAEELEFGEFVITNMFYESMVYIRWRAEDFVTVRWDPCPYCGFTHMQVRVMGRTSESVDVKGKLITMGQVDEIIHAHPETRFLPAQLIREEPQPQDKLRLRVCYNAELVKEPEQYRLRLADEYKNKLGVDTSVDLITMAEIAALPHKFVRVVKEKRQG
jgi:phenylacetate-CoA ligase